MKSRIFVTAALLAIASPAVAADATPTCGKTASECQKVVDDLTGRLGVATLQAQGLTRQRNAQATAAMDTDLNAFVQQQQAAIAAQPVPKAPPK